MAIMPIVQDRYTRTELNYILSVLFQVVVNFVQFHSLSATVEHGMIPYLGQVVRPDRIIVNIQKHVNMVLLINTVCHEYCHLLQYERLDQLGDVANITRDIQKFYTTEYHEYCNLDLRNALEYLVYWCSPFETEARAFARRWGIVDTGHCLLSVNLQEIRQAHESHNLIHMVKSEYQQLDFLFHEELSELGPDHRKLLLQILSQD